MVVKICDRCNEAYSTESHEVDFVHACSSGNDTLDNEDVLEVGNWEDYTGSGIVTNPLMQGQANKLWGTRGAIEGGESQTLTRRGRSTQTHRTRQHLAYNEFEGGVTL